MDTEELLVGILVVIIGWFSTNIIVFLLKRYRLKAAIIADINNHLLGAKDARTYLNNLFEQIIKENKPIEYAFRFIKSENLLYKSMQEDLIKFFGKKNLIKIIIIYDRLWEAENAIEALMGLIIKWRNEKRVLSGNDIEFLKSNRNKVIKLIDVITEKEIKGLEDLKEDYRGHLK